MNKEITPITNIGNTCCNCLKETSNIHNISIPSMGWGSGFDNWSTQIDLCDECYSKTNSKWWKLKTIKGKTDWDGIYYEFEDEIFKYVRQMPLAGQQLFWNHYAYGACADYNMEAQDWIDYELGILPHEKCKEYGYYSPQEINAYHERFPKCQHPANEIFNDDSKGCWCPFGSHGKYGQICDTNISNQCYQCKYYTERTTPIRDILHKDFNDYEIYYKAKLNAEKYKNKFE
jgi:hypothetical protein